VIRAQAPKQSNELGKQVSETILVGADGTAASRAALRWSVKRATAIGAAVSLVHVLDDDWVTIGERMIEDLRDEAQGLMEREADYARSLAPKVLIHTQLLHGSVMQELISASDRADIVVVGTHKTGFINGRVFGSRSLRLAAAARAPVAIIPQTAERDGRGVVVGVDDSAVGRKAIRFAAIEANRAREMLTLLRAFTIPGAPNDNGELVRRAEARVAKELSAAATLVSSVAPTVEVRVHSVQRPAAEALVDAATSAALLIIGNSRQEDSGKVMVGSVTHDVLINLTGPTIVVHSGDHQ
jgi:nucleotide-binding universal stress UspA family protein